MDCVCMEKPERRDGKLSAAPGFRKGHQCHRNGESANAVATISLVLRSRHATHL